MKIRLVGDRLSVELFRLAGIQGSIVDTAQQVREKIQQFLTEDSVGIVLVTSSCAALMGEDFKPFLQRRKPPLVLRIPDRYRREGDAAEIKEYLQRSLGIRL